MITAIADAITRQEGTTNPGTRGYRNNNPGNLRDRKNKKTGAWSIWPQLPHDAEAFPKFASWADGRAALERDLGLKIGRGLNLKQVIHAWAPAGDGDNDPEGYCANVATWTGLPIDKPLKRLAQATVPA